MNSEFIHVEIFDMHSDCAGSQNLLGANRCSSRLCARETRSSPLRTLEHRFRGRRNTLCTLSGL